jgi:hypothetical protein
MNGDSLLCLPGDTEFEWTLQNMPPPGSGKTFVMDLSGIMREVDEDELTEYLEGGEYSERLEMQENDMDTLWESTFES